MVGRWPHARLSTSAIARSFAMRERKNKTLLMLQGLGFKARLSSTFKCFPIGSFGPFYYNFGKIKLSTQKVEDPIMDTLST